MTVGIHVHLNSWSAPLSRWFLKDCYDLQWASTWQKA